MNHLHKLKPPSLLKWVSFESPRNLVKSSESLFSICLEPFNTVETPTFYSNRAGNIEDDKILEEKVTPTPKLRSTSRNPGFSRKQTQAQTALLENLHGTRNLAFTDAEHISKNCPIFINKLLEKVEDGQEIGKSLSKFFRYHPINEFEPFFESIGLRPLEIYPILPCDKMFLRDDSLLLDNYHALSDYGIPRSMIGKFYKEAMEIFGYENGVLYSKLQAYEALGLTTSSVIKVMASSPYLLSGNANEDFVKMLDLLKSLGIEFKWIEERLSKKNSYDWSQMLRYLIFVSEMGYQQEELVKLMTKYPGLLLNESGENAILLVGLLLKIGSTRKEVSSLFPRFPRVELVTFLKNFRQCLHFLIDIEMEAEEIRKIVYTHPLLLGSCSLKKTKTILTTLNVGKKRLQNIIMEDPYQLKNWLLGLKLEPMPNSGEKEMSLLQKTEFLLTVGFVENSDELKKALKVFRGKGGELQERFECFIKAGLDREDVIHMIGVSPRILNLTKDVIEQKIDFLVNVICYPISSLVAFPSYVCYTTERVRLRFLMYNWLKDEGVVAPKLALSTILACSDEAFVRKFVRYHPRGLEVWENMKKENCV